MKKISMLAIFVLFMAGSVFAQPNAIDFTATDVNGNSHNLFSYLDAGKHVAIMFTITN